jgi:hypothetical protein
MQMPDFIEVYDDFFPVDQCQHYIDFFQVMQESGFVQDRQQRQNIRPHQVSDSNFDFGDHEVILDFSYARSLTSEFMQRFWNEIYPRYTAKFSMLDTADQHSILNLKMQRTQPGEAYHVWHYETAMRDFRDRILTFTLYLNDVEQGGETEFLYYPRRIDARAGRIALFPAGFTHAHRGNQPLTGDKYILTGWITY